MGPDPSPRELYSYLQAAGVSERDVPFIQEMWKASPSRYPLRLQGPSLKGIHQSRKVSTPCYFESTAERCHLLSLDIDPDVLAYRVQVPCSYVRIAVSPKSHRRSHVTADALVLTVSGPRLVEVKTRTKLGLLCRDKPWRWKLDQDGCYTDESLREWSQSHGLTHAVWTNPSTPGIHLSNLELLRALSLRDQSEPFKPSNELSALLLARAVSLEEALHTDPECTVERILTAVAKGELHGPIQSVSMTNLRHFMVTPHKLVADAVNQQIEQGYEGLLQPQIESSKILSASPSDIEGGQRRLRRILQGLNGDVRLHQRDIALAEAVVEQIKFGRNPLEVTLTKKCQSGNRTPRLQPLIDRVTQHCIRKYWSTQKLSFYGALKPFFLFQRTR